MSVFLTHVQEMAKYHCKCDTKALGGHWKLNQIFYNIAKKKKKTQPKIGESFHN